MDPRVNERLNAIRAVLEIVYLDGAAAHDTIVRGALEIMEQIEGEDWGRDPRFAHVDGRMLTGG